MRIETSWWPLAVGLALFLPAVSVASWASAHSIEKTFSLFLVTPVVVGAPMVRMRDGARRTWFVALAGLLGLSVSCWLILGGRAEPGSARISVGGANLIGLGLVACIGALVLGLGAWQRRGMVRLLCCVGFLVCSVATVGTGSRGPLVAAAAAILLVRLRYMPSRSRLGLVLTLAVVGVAGRRRLGARTAGRPCPADDGAGWRNGPTAWSAPGRVGADRLEPLGRGGVG